jgi:hypothetical protein
MCIHANVPRSHSGTDAREDGVFIRLFRWHRRSENRTTPRHFVVEVELATRRCCRRDLLINGPRQRQLCRSPIRLSSYPDGAARRGPTSHLKRFCLKPPAIPGMGPQKHALQPLMKWPGGKTKLLKAYRGLLGAGALFCDIVSKDPRRRIRRLASVRW